MTTRPIRSILVAAGLVSFGLATSACNGPRVLHEQPVLPVGQRVADPARSTPTAAVAAANDQRGAAATAMTDALASCAPAVCAALARGEVALGMSEAELLAASGSTAAAWSARRGSAATVLVPATPITAPADARGELAMVQLVGGRVSSIAYRDASGIRVVQSEGDATTAGRAAATGRALIDDGDRLVAAGDRAGALDRYDRALVLLPNDATLQYRVATLLDQELRPVEALMRYRRFLNQLEIQRIDATGTANAKLAEAVARAHERIVVLEKRNP